MPQDQTQGSAPPAAITAKTTLRRQLNHNRAVRLANSTFESRNHAAEQLAQSLLRTKPIQSAIASGQPIASYLPLATEPDTSVFHNELTQLGVTVLVPECLADTDGEPALAWLPLNRDNDQGSEPSAPKIGSLLLTDARGIPIPSGSRIGIGTAGLAVANCRTVIVPALAATEAGQRLGKGAGYYDRLLSAAATVALTLTTIAVVFADEKLDSIPTDAHDASVSAVVTVE